MAGAAKNMEEWIRNPLLYEIGQKTVSNAIYEGIANLSTLQRGAKLLESQGCKALSISFTKAWGFT